jgi:predicted transcriptional regulator
MSARRDADYWQQKYIDREMKPLAEVAKCYKQVEPEQLLLSDDAKVVCEMLRANGPMTSYEISERLNMFERRVLASFIEAKEAGIVRLDDGKYSIVRD